MAGDITGMSVSDEATKETIRSVFRQYGYVLDPHSAVGFRALETYRAESGNKAAGIVLSTAHPAKFLEVIEDVLDIKVDIPERLSAVLEKEKRSTLIGAEYDDLAGFLKHLDR
jgi:threonine synthase